jgi:heme A synthase
MRTLIGLSGFFVAVPLLVAWVRIRHWDWLANRHGKGSR